MSYANEKIEELAEYLEGTRNTFDHACQIHGLVEEAFSRENWIVFEDLVAECEDCGWWYSIDNMNYNSRADMVVCDECFGNEDEDE